MRAASLVMEFCAWGLVKMELSSLTRSKVTESGSGYEFFGSDVRAFVHVSWFIWRRLAASRSLNGVTRVCCHQAVF
jgi:hypothetical protein